MNHKSNPVENCNYRVTWQHGVKDYFPSHSEQLSAEMQPSVCCYSFRNVPRYSGGQSMWRLCSARLWFVTTSNDIDKQRGVDTWCRERLQSSRFSESKLREPLAKDDARKAGHTVTFCHLLCWALCREPNCPSSGRAQGPAINDSIEICLDFCRSRWFSWKRESLTAYARGARSNYFIIGNFLPDW